MNLSKRYNESLGPGADSGWYWTEKALYFFNDIPAIVLSFKLIWVISKSFGRLLFETAKPWFWEVISILEFFKFLTGWFEPLWPNFNLNVFAPIAKDNIWWPKQIPKIGFLPINDFTVLTA